MGTGQEETVKMDRDCDWRTQFAPGQVIQRVRPKESFAYLGNPHKGTATFQRFNGDPLYERNTWSDRDGPLEFKPFDGNLKNPRYPDTTISYCRWIWSVMEPEKGRYRWDVIEGALEAARVRGQTLQVRMQPYAGDDLPQWFWDLGGVRQQKPTEYKFCEPDINHPLYIKHWADFIRAFGRRYDGHPDLESFDIAFGGPWGERGGNANKETSKTIVDVYLRSFRKTQLVSMIGAHGLKYAATTGRRIGWRADCFGDVGEEGGFDNYAPGFDNEGPLAPGQRWGHMYNAYPREIFEGSVQDAWKQAPVTLETCWTVGHWYEHGWDIDWIIEQGYRYHVSVFMPKSCYIPDEWMPKIEEFNRRMGYQYALRQMVVPIELKVGYPIKVEVWIDNVACAPIYRAYRFAYRFRQNGREGIVQSKQDLRGWLPGYVWFSDRVTPPAWLKPGAAKVDVGIVDPASGKPRVRLAIENVREDGWHPMAIVGVV